MRLAAPTNFACYYGRNHLSELAGYNLAILQVEQYTPEELATLVGHGVTVVAYVSLGAVPVAEADDRWVLRDPATGESIIDPRWGTTAIDCRSEDWHRHLLEVRMPELLARGASGLFLDTVDVQEAHPQTRYGVTELLHSVRRELPSTVIVINRGFTILDTVLSVADAVAFEAFSSHYDGTTYALWQSGDLAWTAQMAAQLNQTRGACPILTIDYAGPGDHALRERVCQRSRRYGFIPYVSTYALDWLPEPR